MQEFRSEDLPPAERFDYWCELLSKTHAPMALSSDYAADFTARQRLIRLGGVSLWPTTFQPLVFDRTPKLIEESDPEAIHLSLLLKGAGGVIREREQASYRPYDFHSSFTSQPYTVWSGSEPVTMIGVEVPKTLLPLPRAERVVGRPLSGRDGVGALLAQCLCRIAEDTASYGPADGPRLGAVVADLVAAMCAHVLDAERALLPETRRQTLLLQVKAFIQRHLSDPELTPTDIAAAHHISLRQLHRLFRQEETTVAAVIRRSRLERARADLDDPALNTALVHHIGARWGFSSAESFSRAFRAAYGRPPADYRSALPRITPSASASRR
ncbi:helix-turn-helix domain-containing protein [Streptomyces sp. NPDC020965]|uniref:helix-turn-helix domain-containing protein n=1 Tax=Streptomyces sp. NPDC020965 TaxID=3365105 RepID=UPI003793F0C4